MRHRSNNQSVQTSSPISLSSTKAALHIVRRPNPGSHKPGQDHSLRIIIGFLLCMGMALGLLFYVSSRKPVEIRQSMTRFNQLQEIYSQEGIQKFLEAKAGLKQDITNLMSDPDEEVQNEADNVAVYLFPEALPDDNYEKPVALSQWKPLEEAIEKSPRSTQSRALFEELRANIWNYESPEKTNPNLSATAKEVIRIYEKLSAP